MEYFSVFSPNAGKYGPEKHRIGTFFTQWKLLVFLVFSKNKYLLRHDYARDT